VTVVRHPRHGRRQPEPHRVWGIERWMPGRVELRPQCRLIQPHRRGHLLEGHSEQASTMVLLTYNFVGTPRCTPGGGSGNVDHRLEAQPQQTARRFDHTIIPLASVVSGEVLTGRLRSRLGLCLSNSFSFREACGERSESRKRRRHSLFSLLSPHFSSRRPGSPRAQQRSAPRG
jgi:hypothetical protein